MKIFGLTIKRESTASSGTSSSTSSTTTTTSGVNWYERLLGNSNPDVAAKVSTVYFCVSVIANAIAVMPLYYKKQDKATGVMRVWTKRDKDRLNYLLNVRPNSRMNAFDFKRQLIAQKLTMGNAFILPVNENGNALPDFENYTIDHLVLLNPDGVKYDVTKDAYTVVDPEQGVKSQTISSSQIWHIKNMNFGAMSGFWGQSTLHYALTSIQMGATGNNEMLKRVANGGRNKCILSYENPQTPFGVHNKDQMKGAADDLSAEIADKDIFTLPYKGLTLTPFSMNSADLKLLETAELSRADIAHFFHVPLYMLGQQSSNYKTPDSAATTFINECLTPHCAQIETEIHSKYCTDKDWWQMQFDFDEEARRKLDVESQTKKDVNDLSTGVCTINELRAKRGKMPVEGGDEILVSANMKTAAMLKNEGAGGNQVKPAAKDDKDE